MSFFTEVSDAMLGTHPEPIPEAAEAEPAVDLFAGVRDARIERCAVRLAPAVFAFDLAAIGGFAADAEIARLSNDAIARLNRSVASAREAWLANSPALSAWRTTQGQLADTEAALTIANGRVLILIDRIEAALRADADPAELEQQQRQGRAAVLTLTDRRDVLTKLEAERKRAAATSLQDAIGSAQAALQREATEGLNAATEELLRAVVPAVLLHHAAHVAHFHANTRESWLHLAELPK